MNREWQCATIQCDFSLPERFDLTYTNEAGELVRPIMIHRAILGSVERFMGTLIEHYAGAFPMWLAPVQLQIIPIKDDHVPFASQLKKDLKDQGFRVQIDQRNESLNKRIREGTVKKIPYLLIVGDKEVSEKKVALRKYGEGDIGAMSQDQLLERFLQEVKDKR